MAGQAKPDWLKKRAPAPQALLEMKGLLSEFGLHAVCESAICPNIGECFARRVATFMILGDICTRHCNFCAVAHGEPLPPDENEPEHVASAVKKLGLRYVVVTSVTRDDLPDGGAYQFAKVSEATHSLTPEIVVEVLVPDFKGSLCALNAAAEGHPEIIAHNLETVPRLYAKVRPQADYRRSLNLLRNAKTLGAGFLTKSGLMLGLGEKQEEVIQVMMDLREIGCDFLTLGQYLRPSPVHYEVVRFIPPGEFEEYRTRALAMGFKGVAAAPFVRSSFQADRLFWEAKLG